MARGSLLLWGIITAATMVAGGAGHAFSPADIQKLIATGSCQECDLSGADLSDTDLSRADLSGADLSGAKLDDTVLYGSDLSGAKFDGADFSGTTWTDGTRCNEGSVGRCKK